MLFRYRVWKQNGGLPGLTANRVGKANDGGINIEVNMNVQGAEYSYYIQCKYYNKPLGKGPIQEVYSKATLQTVSVFWYLFFSLER